jgi:hypothetical protein
MLDKLQRYGRRQLGLLRLRLSFTWRIRVRQEPSVVFVCNLCGARSHSPLIEVRDREARSCVACGSCLRFRAVVQALTRALLGKDLVLSQLAVRDDLIGIGVSDEELYARFLRKKFAYTNTYYHQEPYLDITQVGTDRQPCADFVLCSDVLEHVTPPVSRAFDGLFALLKPGGIAIITVPFSLEAQTREHFPELHDFRLTQENGTWVLHNRCSDGRNQIFRDLVFHGGPGRTLEMRVFSESQLVRELEAAGFPHVEKLSASCAAFGICRNGAADAVFVARRPTPDIDRAAPTV